MTKKEAVIAVIEFVKKTEKSRGRSEYDVFGGGNCGNLYFLLKSVFPEAEAYGMQKQDKKHISHVLTKIDGIFYDHWGVWRPDDFSNKDNQIRPITDEEVKNKLSNNYEKNEIKENNLFPFGRKKAVLLDKKIHEENLVMVRKYCEGLNKTTPTAGDTCV